MASALSSPLLTSIALTSIKLREFNLRDVNLARHKPRKQCVAEGDKRPRFDFIVSDLSINGRDFFFSNACIAALLGNAMGSPFKALPFIEPNTVPSPL